MAKTQYQEWHELNKGMREVPSQISAFGVPIVSRFSVANEYIKMLTFLRSGMNSSYPILSFVEMLNYNSDADCCHIHIKKEEVEKKEGAIVVVYGLEWLIDHAKDWFPAFSMHLPGGNNISWSACSGGEAIVLSGQSAMKFADIINKASDALLFDTAIGMGILAKMGMKPLVPAPSVGNADEEMDFIRSRIKRDVDAAGGLAWRDREGRGT